MAPGLLSSGPVQPKGNVVLRSRESGFSMVELMMTLAIIAIIAAVALPQLDFQRYRMDGATRSLSGLLARAQILAVKNQSNVNVVFDVANQRVMMHEDDNNDNAVNNNERVRYYPLGETVVYGTGPAPTRVFTPAPVTFTRAQAGMPEIVFRRDGSASENGAIYITSLNAATTGRSKDARSVETVMATGRIEWFKYTGSTWARVY
jgi:prepilin-type N-terminal cleavage/methylation domain-containing protein